MQMLNQRQDNNNKKIKSGLRKSQLLLIGSFLVFIGFFVLTINHLLFLKDQVYANMKIAMMDMEYNRIFMTFAKAYYYVEACRLNAIKNKIEGYKNLATEIMSQLNLLAALPDPKNTNPKVTFVKR